MTKRNSMRLTQYVCNTVTITYQNQDRQNRHTSQNNTHRPEDKHAVDSKTHFNCRPADTPICSRKHIYDRSEDFIRLFTASLLKFYCSKIIAEYLAHSKSADKLNTSTSRQLKHTHTLIGLDDTQAACCCKTSLQYIFYQTYKQRHTQSTNAAFQHRFEMHQTPVMTEPFTPVYIKPMMQSHSVINPQKDLSSSKHESGDLVERINDIADLIYSCTVFKLK